MADKYIAAFREDVTALGVSTSDPALPRVVDYMTNIIDFVQVLGGQKDLPMSQRAMSIFEWKKSH